jgi:hypothetical protein
MCGNWQKYGYKKPQQLSPCRLFSVIKYSKSKVKKPPHKWKECLRNGQLQIPCSGAATTINTSFYRQVNWCKSGTRQQTVHHPSDWHSVFPSCHQCMTLAPNIHTETLWMLCHSHSIKSTYRNTSLTILNTSVRILWKVSSLICLKIVIVAWKHSLFWRLNSPYSYM